MAKFWISFDETSSRKSQWLDEVAIYLEKRLSDHVGKVRISVKSEASTVMY